MRNVRTFTEENLSKIDNLFKYLTNNDFQFSAHYVRPSSFEVEEWRNRLAAKNRTLEDKDIPVMQVVWFS